MMIYLMIKVQWERMKKMKMTMMMIKIRRSQEKILDKIKEERKRTTRRVDKEETSSKNANNNEK